MCGLRIKLDFELIKPITHERNQHAITITELVVERGDRDSSQRCEFAHREALKTVISNQRASSNEDIAARLLLSTLPAICHRDAS